MRLAPAGLCAALALLTAALFPGCLNPRPEEDPSVVTGVGVDGVPDVGSSAGSGGSGAGGDLNAGPDEETVAPPPASSEPDAGVSNDAGVAPAADAAAGSASDADAD